jgi:anthranilate phosphoribosyltransferase
MIREAIAALVERRDLTETEAAAVTDEIMQGEATPSQVSAFLTALRMKGETADEIAGMARTMRAKAVGVPVSGDLLDIVSTGGGAFDPVNISTASALVCSGAGVRVAKHGNRGFTSASGAADVLEALGAKLELTPEQAAECIESVGFAFLFAQSFHPAMRHAGPTRREIGIRTIFNSLGPLTNPAGANHQLLGAGDSKLAPKIAEVVARLGTTRTLVVHAEDGLDEVSLGAPTAVFDVTAGGVRPYVWTAADAGLPSTPVAEVKTGSASENASRISAVLAGTPGPDRDYVVVNAAAGLVAAGRAASLADGVKVAADSIDSGAAAGVLRKYVDLTRKLGGS